MLDEALSALSNIHRRRVLMALIEHPSSDPDRIDVPGGIDPTGTLSEAVHVELHHTHLPQLEEAGFIDWEASEGTVARGVRFDEIEPLLELLAKHTDELPGEWV